MHNKQKKSLNKKFSMWKLTFCILLSTFFSFFLVHINRATEGVNEQCISKSSTDKLLPKISINTSLAAEIILSEASKSSNGKNVVVSPLSLEFALHMVAAGSKGETLSQILQFIGNKNYPLINSTEDLKLKSSDIMKVASSFCKSEKESELSFVNGAWVDRRFKLISSYKELMTSVYKARAESVDFNKQAGKIARNINSWVADKTKGVIRNILEPESISRETSLILVNALYFKGIWSENSKFDEDLTVDKDFHLLDGKKIYVPFMSRHSPNYLYGEFDGFRAVQVNYQYQNDELRQFAMQILLPNERDGLQNLMNKFLSDPSLLSENLTMNYEDFKEFRIPKFKFTYEPENVVEVMKKLGLTRPFEIDCEDFTEMVELENGKNIYVSDIIHKATIEVSESKTMAAAASVVEFFVTCALSEERPPTPTLRFVADHPFMFLIKEVNSGAIFFMGAVFNPLLED